MNHDWRDYLGYPPEQNAVVHFDEIADLVHPDDCEIWGEWAPHLIWMDMRMPVMDGHEATRRIKATTRGQARVIIALTASAFGGRAAYHPLRRL